MKKELKAMFSAAFHSFLTDRSKNPRNPVCSKSSLEVPVFIVKQGGCLIGLFGGPDGNAPMVRDWNAGLLPDLCVVAQSGLSEHSAGRSNSA